MILPVCGYLLYSFSFPFIAHSLFHPQISKLFSNLNHAKKIHTAVVIALFFAIFFAWMYVIGSKVYTFIFPILAVAGLLPIFKLAAYEMRCLKQDESTQLDSNFWNFYIYLISPSEVSFEPDKSTPVSVSKERLKNGFYQLLFLYYFNRLVINFNLSQHPVLEAISSSLQLAACFGAVGDLSVGVLGFIVPKNIFLHDMFNKPYLAITPREFWSTRWNVTVHKCCVKLIYLPLGGSSRRSLNMPVIFLTVGLLHEIPMLCLPSSRLGYWILLFTINLCAIFVQLAFESAFPHLKKVGFVRLAFRIFTLSVISFSAYLAYIAFGMNAQSMASDFNTIIDFVIDLSTLLISSLVNVLVWALSHAFFLGTTLSFYHSLCGQTSFNSQGSILTPNNKKQE
eukprot:TRINITY_DN2861_c0_g1_i2.p1 TRINITY_DN2861_c0_g1~~TRINITY_DN2861_c0_g1_i2.p1  ORF type:complete len:396 (-),score=48.93 TRINITY_DN2861_c0_g1_i2:193-1380(-)